MPDLISGNTNAVCMMIGEKLGRQLIEGGASEKMKGPNESDMTRPEHSERSMA